MFEYVKMKIVQQAENPHWLFRGFVGTGKELNGRIVKFKDGTIGIACIETSRNFILIEKEKEMIEVIKKRAGDFNKSFHNGTLIDALQ